MTRDMIVVTQLVLLPLVVLASDLHRACVGETCADPEAISQPIVDISESEDSSFLLQTKSQEHKLAPSSSSEVMRVDDEHCFLEGGAEADVLVGKSEHIATLETEKVSGLCDWNPQSVQDLSSHYNEIFKDANMNRNAASHLWASFILDRAHCLSHKQIVHMFGGFCAVSGSPVGEPAESEGFKQNLEMVGGGTKTGYTYHCCWPCFCDEKANIKVDTKKVKDKDDKEETYFFEVIGDPCVKKPTVCSDDAETGCIPQSAPGVKCIEGKLKGATFSDNQHPIIGMYFTDTAGLEKSLGGDSKKLQAQDGSMISFNKACKLRKESGMQSGMGTIFDNVAKMNPIST